MSAPENPASWPAEGPNAARQFWTYQSKPKGSFVFTVYDRQVRIEDASIPPSLYAACRSWLQNVPDQLPPRPVEAHPSGLPPPLPEEKEEPIYEISWTVDDKGRKRSEGIVYKNSEFKLDQGAGVQDGIEAQCAKHQQRWRRLGSLFRGKAMKKSTRYCHRLSLLIPTQVLSMPVLPSAQ